MYRDVDGSDRLFIVCIVVGAAVVVVAASHLVLCFRIEKCDFDELLGWIVPGVAAFECILSVATAAKNSDSIISYYCDFRY